MQLDANKLMSDLEICSDHDECENCPNEVFCENCALAIGISYDYIYLALKARGVIYES